MLEKLKADGDQKLENMKREQTVLCDVEDMRSEHDKLGLKRFFDDHEWYEVEDHNLFIARQFGYTINPSVEGLHTLNDNKTWLVTDYTNDCIKIFNVNDNKMTRRIRLSSPPWGITEISSTDPSQSLIAFSFPPNEQIHIMNVHCTPAHVISSINVQGGRCYDLAHCNNKLITRCSDYLDGERYSIHVLNMSGEIINIIDLQNLPSFKLERLFMSNMSVHSKSETIYVCLCWDPSCVISLSLDGQLLDLHSITFTDLNPRLIHVDKNRNVYVMGFWLPIYKLSADLKNREKIIDSNVINDHSMGDMEYLEFIVRDIDENPEIRAMRFHNDKFYLASDEGHVYIIQHDSSRTHDQSENCDENHPVRYKRNAEQLNPTLQSDGQPTKRRPYEMLLVVKKNI